MLFISKRFKIYFLPVALVIGHAFGGNVTMKVGPVGEDLLVVWYVQQAMSPTDGHTAMLYIETLTNQFVHQQGGCNRL